VLINLVPDFLGVLAHEGPDERLAAYRRYFEAHRPLLTAYWDNYVVDPDGAHFDEVARAVTSAERDDLHAVLAAADVAGLADAAHERARALLEADVATDVVARRLRFDDSDAGTSQGSGGPDPDDDPEGAPG